MVNARRHLDYNRHLEFGARDTAFLGDHIKIFVFIIFDDEEVTEVMRFSSEGLGDSMTGLVPRQVVAVIPPALAEGVDIPALGSWLMSDEGRRDPSVCQWINFLTAHYAQFRIILELFPKVNPGRQSMKDQSCVLTNPEEMLVIANHLFILRSYGVEGAVLECGCFKGFSSCCLSIACRRLGYPLVIADSFAGLPPVPDEVGEDRFYTNVERVLPH
jgi:hypothetical protein